MGIRDRPGTGNKNLYSQPKTPCSFRGERKSSGVSAL